MPSIPLVSIHSFLKILTDHAEPSYPRLNEMLALEVQPVGQMFVSILWFPQHPRKTTTQQHWWGKRRGQNSCWKASFADWNMLGPFGGESYHSESDAPAYLRHLPWKVWHQNLFCWHLDAREDLLPISSIWLVLLTCKSGLGSWKIYDNNGKLNIPCMDDIWRYELPNLPILACSISVDPALFAIPPKKSHAKRIRATIKTKWSTPMSLVDSYAFRIASTYPVFFAYKKHLGVFSTTTSPASNHR